MNSDQVNRQFVSDFRQAAPYIHAHRGSTVVLAFGGEAIADESFPDLVHDIALLHSLGIRLVLVHGARPQIEHKLKASGAQLEYANGLRITDDAALVCVKEAAGSVRVEVEALLSMGLANTPMSGARIGVSSGNFVTARPLGVVDGIDYCHTGEVRRVDSKAIQQHLDGRRIVLLSPIGYSPTGEIFNLSVGEIATQAAAALNADKLIFITEGNRPRNGRRQMISKMDINEANALLGGKRRLDETTRQILVYAVQACQHNVRRVHILDRSVNGALLLELFTRDGHGTLVTADVYEGLREATIEDVGGILELIKPLEQEGVLVRRSRERLEIEINHFVVIERDGTIIACAALYPFAMDGHAELACLAVHEDYRNAGRGDALLQYIEQRAARSGIRRLVVLTTRTAHWFLERGFQAGNKSDLPASKQALYNYRRNSKVFYKLLGEESASRSG
ncbi:MAG TPA: amino-acid N-acetyltransferase [Gammaproteobacteria bacterium]|jgi:amino-acid N-acetyltransferase|nr:amino-acid N-acetyltransferase [Gammaproteobacteria bacterium]